ncbi:DUF192 domain-containing protein [Halobacteria archaeon AArc-dxtr1]|nr:DUF192 domain-containing protein [Halobacteria archaeon AArc-dxtr1]
MTRYRAPSRLRSRRAHLAGTGALLASAVLAGCADADGTDDADSSVDDPDNGGAGDAESADGDGGTDAQSADGGDNSESDDADGASVHDEYETTDVRVLSAEGDELGSVTAAIADTPHLRRTGLSETPSLPVDRGMLFVYGESGQRTFVMREMDFGIDIVYADADGTITEIHHAPEPEPDEDGADQRYPGTGQYVLEVGYEWTADRDIEAGDVLSFEL